ncbi:hypothetical protein KCP70_17415 [Salmonella enterica subsp. enterica]|nr:hypothetical protein KCP70_17415 [Salmonella enterica subsp. enterica]
MNKAGQTRLVTIAVTVIWRRRPGRRFTLINQREEDFRAGIGVRAIWRALDDRRGSRRKRK